MIISISSGVVVLGIIAAIVLPIILRVDYSEAYKKAGALQDEISDIYNDYDCENVEDYVTSTWASNKKYAEYVEGCRTVGEKANSLIAELESTAGVQRNSEIKAQFDSFKRAYDASVTSGDEKAAALELYSTWHAFVVAADDVDSWDETDADLAKAANVLINSGNDKLKTYGEGWLEHRKKAAAAYRAYWAASYSASNKSALRTAMYDAQTAHNDWVAENKPSIKDLASVQSSDVSKMKQEFDKLYELIRETYEKNYNSDSGDCWEFVGEVVCD